MAFYSVTVFYGGGKKIRASVECDEAIAALESVLASGRDLYGSEEPTGFSVRKIDLEREGR